MKKLPLIILTAILTMAALLRLYHLAEIPPGVNRDEASIGYTAYSLLKTGRDEYGRLLPLSFQSFGDWKLPFYIYLTVPLVNLLGLSEVAVRLPSALFGTVAVLLTYFLAKELFKNNSIALLAAFLLAVSPWQLHLSRVESEANVAVFLVTAGLLLFLKGLKQRPFLTAASLLLFALTYFTYHGNHIFTTLFLIGLFLIYRKLIPRANAVAFSAIISALLVVFILSQTLTQADKTKVSGISIFGDPNVIHEKIELPRSTHDQSQGLVAKILHNRVIWAWETVSQNYLKSFSPEFLFIKGGGNRAHNIANFGNMYLVEAPFFWLGIYWLIKSRRHREYQLLFWWLAVSPVASSITKDAPHTNRLFAIQPLPAILVALGIYWFWQLLDKRIKPFVAALLIIVFALNVALYLDRYFFHFPKNESQFWGYGYKKLAVILNSPDLLNKKIVISSAETSPYIYLLFYSGFDPLRYQKSVQRYPPTADQFVHVKGFDRFEFREIDWGKDLEDPHNAVVDFSQNIPATLPPAASVQNIYLPNGRPFLTVVTAK